MAPVGTSRALSPGANALRAVRHHPWPPRRDSPCWCGPDPGRQSFLFHCSVSPSAQPATPGGSGREGHCGLTREPASHGNQSVPWPGMMEAGTGESQAPTRGSRRPHSTNPAAAPRVPPSPRLATAWPLLPFVCLPISSCFQDAGLCERHIQRLNTTSGPLESPQGRSQHSRLGVKDTRHT